VDRTLILVKPDAFARNLTGEIIARFERKGLRIAALRHMTMDVGLAERHYAEHQGKPFFGELVSFITSGPLVAMVLEGQDAVRAARQVIGATNPLEAAPGSIRGDFAVRQPGVGRAGGGAVLRRAGLILASASPQRRAILAQVGIPFEVRPAGVEEETAGEPAAVAEANARRKATAVPGELVLGADTIVAVDGAILGKPRDEAQAREFLCRLAGCEHRVVGAIALAAKGEVVQAAVEITSVRFRDLDDPTLDWYVRSREWEGRAGGYAIQGRGAALIAGIQGDYLNVVGLPLARLLELRPDLLPLT
jgi:septum formation protein